MGLPLSGRRSLVWKPAPCELKLYIVSCIMRSNMVLRPVRGLVQGELSRRERLSRRVLLRELLLLPWLLKVSKWAPRSPPNPNENPPIMESFQRKVRDLVIACDVSCVTTKPVGSDCGYRQADAVASNRIMVAALTL
jgi:hypothetical protein